MISELEAAERAEFIQSVKALLIPSSLFVACVIMAAGTFLIYNHEPLGWWFAGLSTIMIVSAIIALIRFQNKFRAKGVLKHGTAPEVIGESEQLEGANSASNVVDFRPPADGDPTITQADQAVGHH